MAQLDEKARAMDAVAFPDFAWLQSAAGHLFDLFGVSGVVLAWRAGSRVTKFEIAGERQREINGEVKARLDAHQAAEATIREKIAELPKRDEIVEMFRELREDIRGLKRG